MSTARWVGSSLPYVTATGEARDEWAEEARRLGGRGTQQLGEVGESTAPPEIAEALGADLVVIRRRVMFLDDRPVELTDSYYPPEIARGTALAEPRKIRGGAVRLLAELGHRPRRIREDVYSHRPTTRERDALRLDDQDWTLQIFRVSSTETGLPVEVSVLTMPAESRRLRYEIHTE
jgi:GntR family transcriptional regulator